MSIAPEEKLYSEEEYLALERDADHKSEFVNGRIYAMAGASEPHNVAAVNILSDANIQFKGRPCRAYGSDMRVRVSATKLNTYPDVVLICGEPQFRDDKRDTLLNPTVLVEVLSPSTEAYDRGTKLLHYRQLESLHDYLLVSQDRIQIDHYSRTGERWILNTYTDLDDIIELDSVGIELLVRNIYDKVELPSVPVPPTQP